MPSPLQRLVPSSFTLYSLAPASTHDNPLLADKETLSNIIKAGPKDNYAVYNAAIDRIFAGQSDVFRDAFFNDPDVQRRSIKGLIDRVNVGENIDDRIRDALNSHTCQSCLTDKQQLQLMARIKNNPGVRIANLGLDKFFVNPNVAAHSQVVIDSGCLVKEQILEKLNRPLIERLASVSAKKPELLSDYLGRLRDVRKQSLTEAETYLNPEIVQIAGDGWCYLNAVFSGIILDCAEKPEKLRDFANKLQKTALEISQLETPRFDALMQVIQGLHSLADQGVFSREQALHLISDELGVILVLSGEIGGHVFESAHNATIAHFCNEMAPVCGIRTELARRMINELERQDIHNMNRLTFFTSDAEIQRNLVKMGVVIEDAEMRENFVTALHTIEINMTAVKRKTNPDVLDQSITNGFDDIAAEMGYRPISMNRETNDTVERIQRSIDSARGRQEEPLYLRLEGGHYSLLCPNKIIKEEVVVEENVLIEKASSVSDDDLPPIYMPGCVVS